jgi:hypothetical protein
MNGGRVHDPRKGGSDKLIAYDHNNKGYDHRGQVFYPAVAERVFFVGGFVGHSEADEGDDGREYIGDVVNSICRDGDAVHKKPDGNFNGKYNEIDNDTGDSSENAVFFPYRFVCYIVMVMNGFANDEIE